MAFLCYYASETRTTLLFCSVFIYTTYRRTTSTSCHLPVNFQYFRSSVWPHQHLSNVWPWPRPHAHAATSALRPVQTGDYSRRFRRQFVAENGDCCRIRRLLPKPATVAEFGNSRRFWQQSPNSATVAEFGDYSRQCASVDRPFGDSRRFWRQSPNSATVAGFGNSRRIGRL